jgi:hypothetical protein
MVVKVRDMVGISMLVYSQGIPERVVLKEHSLKYEGMPSFKPGQFITGVYGAQSTQTAVVTASRWAQDLIERTGKAHRVLMLDINYKVDNFSMIREQTRREHMEATGWLHLDRLASAFREEVKEQCVAWLHKNAARGVAARAAELTLQEIVLKYPKLVAMLFEEEKSVKAIVHPVRPVLDTSITLWAATIRYEPSRIHNPVLRYLPGVKIDV